ncbi:MAG: hypothetical protein HC830_08060 [Bacteroidetes bacterium]|nr:hypothetical protein [Bacteroidota bacterium]
MKPYEYEYGKPDRWDKTVDALTYIRTAKTKDLYTYKEFKLEKYTDKKIFATFDSLLIMTGLENLLSDPAYKTYLIPTNRAFYAFYIDKINFKSNKQQYFKLADLPDSTRRNIVLTHIIPGRRILADSLEIVDQNKNFITQKGVKMTLKRDASFRITMNYFPVTGSSVGNRARTSNLEPNNGVIHVVDKFYIAAEKDLHLGSSYVEPQ